MSATSHIVPELTHENHFEFGYNNKPFVWRKSVNDEWFVHYGRAKNAPLDFGQECVRTAQLIKEKTKLPIQIMFSGGVDSEVVLRSFVRANIQVEAAILRFKEDLNIHDISWAVVACQELGVPYKFYDLDLLKFWDGPCLEYADATYCISPQLLSTMWLVDQLDGYPVLGSGECLLVRRDAPPPGMPMPSPEYGEEVWEMHEKEKIASWYRHFIVRGRDGCPGFYQYTPEIILSYLSDELIANLCQNKIYGKFSTVSSKFAAYKNHFTELRYREKFTGFEKVMALDAKLREFLVARYPGCGEVIKTSYEDLIKMLKPVSSPAPHISL